MTSTTKLWSVLAALLIFSFGTLLWAGGEIYQNAPPMPEQVVTTEGAVVYTRADIERGRQVWQSIGGMQLGSIWGHGGYVAPDWSADWLHRELVALLDRWAAAEFGAADFAALSGEQQSLLEGRLRERMRQNTAARSRSRRSAPPRSRACRRITRACSAATRRPPGCARTTR